jgi:hypothetical protein
MSSELIVWHFRCSIWHFESSGICVDLSGIFCYLIYQLRGRFYVKVFPWTPWRLPLRHTYMQSSLNRGVLISWVAFPEFACRQGEVNQGSSNSAISVTRVSPVLVMRRILATRVSIAIDCGVNPTGNRAYCLIKGCNDGQEMERLPLGLIPHNQSLA